MINFQMRTQNHDNLKTLLNHDMYVSPSKYCYNFEGQIRTKMNKLIFLAAVLLLSSCQCNSGEGSTSQITKTETGDALSSQNLMEGVNIDLLLANKTDLLPEMCELVSLDEIAAALSLDVSQLTTKNSTPAGAKPNQRTCFFKWNDPNYPNTGIMMQALRNPMEVEFPEYIEVYMTSKRQNGENKLGDDFVHQFKDLGGMADEGIYNADVGKYYWRFSDKVILHLAFNTIHEQEEQFDIAMILGTKMIKNFLAE